MKKNMKSHMTSDKKEFLVSAIGFYKVLPKSTRRLLQELVQLDPGGPFLITPTQLSQVCEAHKYLMYIGLNTLEKHAFIKRRNKYVIELNYSQLNTVSKSLAPLINSSNHKEELSLSA